MAQEKRQHGYRKAATVLTGVLALALAGCGGKAATENPAPSTGGPAAEQPAAPAEAAASVAVEGAWARPAKADAAMGATSAVYFTLHNAGTADDALVGAKAEAVAGKAEVHETVMDASGAMKMQPAPKVAVPAGGAVEFKPGGLHVMLMDLKKDLAEGDTFQVTLTFEKSGEKTVDVTVKAQPATDPMQMEKPHQH